MAPWPGWPGYRDIPARVARLPWHPGQGGQVTVVPGQGGQVTVVPDQGGQVTVAPRPGWPGYRGTRPGWPGYRGTPARVARLPWHPGQGGQVTVAPRPGWPGYRGTPARVARLPWHPGQGGQPWWSSVHGVAGIIHVLTCNLHVKTIKDQLTKSFYIPVSVLLVCLFYLKRKLLEK